MAPVADMCSALGSSPTMCSLSGRSPLWGPYSASSPDTTHWSGSTRVVADSRTQSS